jgi:hypothetical protein
MPRSAGGGLCLYITFSIQLPPAPLRISAWNIGSVAIESGEIVEPIECPMRTTFDLSNLTLPPGASKPGQVEASNESAAMMWAARLSSAADWRMLSRSARRFDVLKIKKSSLPLSRFLSPPSGPSMLAPANPAIAK